MHSSLDILRLSYEPLVPWRTPFEHMVSFMSPKDPQVISLGWLTGAAIEAASVGNTIDVIRRWPLVDPELTSK
jgi:hypothetical protein